jgi:hypothetical protein
MIAVVLILALAAWLPALAQQSGGTQPAPPTDAKQGACVCCDHKDQAGDAAQSCCHGKNGDAKSCCESKDGKQMACCKEHAKGEQSAMNCCKGKDGKMCAKSAKNCCAGKDGKSCCGKDAAACNSKDGKPCCDAATGNCSGSMHS